MKPTNSTPAAPHWQRDRWDEPGTIYFWSGRGGQFERFSNFAITPFAMTSWQRPSEIVTFPSGEHAFQAAKARTIAEHERIRFAASPLAAKRLGRQASLPTGWNQQRRIVMLTVLAREVRGARARRAAALDARSVDRRGLAV